MSPVIHTGRYRVSRHPHGRYPVCTHSIFPLSTMAGIVSVLTLAASNTRYEYGNDFSRSTSIKRMRSVDYDRLTVCAPWRIDNGVQISSIFQCSVHETLIVMSRISLQCLLEDIFWLIEYVYLQWSQYLNKFKVNELRCYYAQINTLSP